MSAQDNMNETQFSGTLYHGSTASFSPGDVLTPGGATSALNSAGVNRSSQGVYLTGNKAVASMYSQGGPVYRVEPTGPLMADPEAKGNGQAFITQHPVNVVGSEEPQTYRRGWGA